MLSLFLQYGDTPLYAASFSNADVVNVLLEHNADPNIRNEVSCLINMSRNSNPFCGRHIRNIVTNLLYRIELC